MNQLKWMIPLLCVAVLLITACHHGETSMSTKPAEVSSAANNVHPEDMGSQDCVACHTDVTPDIVKQWEQSAHGFTGVKCQVCHGDTANFSKIPSDETCRGCHADQFENKNVKSDVSCSTCHTSHNFNVHNVKQYK